MNKMTKIKAEIVADSLSPQGDRLTSLLITFPRIILAEVNTHRMLSKNTSSSRAIPFNKMVESVNDDPFIPIAFQKHHKGMQGSEYLQGEDLENALDRWNDAKNYALAQAKDLYSTGTTKQLCNRILEPFMWTTMLITGSKEGWDNFFELRCPQYYFEPEDKYYKSKKEWVKAWNDTFEVGKDVLKLAKVEDWNTLQWLNLNKGQAEIHMMALAEAIYDAYNESVPEKLEAGEYHIPFGDKMQDKDIMQYIKGKFNSRTEVEEAIQKFKLKISTARCARLSYMTFDGIIDYEKDIKLHDSLLESHHMSPFEHCARAMSEEEYYTFIKGKSNANWDTDLVTDNTYEISAQFDNNVLGWCRNLKGFIPYRAIIENSN